jgi:hypothetical protein
MLEFDKTIKICTLCNLYFALFQTLLYIFTAVLYLDLLLGSYKQTELNANWNFSNQQQIIDTLFVHNI